MVNFERAILQRCFKLSGQGGEKADWNSEFKMFALSAVAENVYPKDFKGGIFTLSFLRLEIKDQNFLFVLRVSDGPRSGLYETIESM